MSEKTQGPETEKEPKSAETREDGKNDKGGKESSDLVREFSIHVPREEIETRIDEVAQTYSSDIKLPGFRKGNVPVELIKSRYRKMIGDEALNKVVEQFVFEKIEKDGLQIVSQPVIEKLDYEEGNDLHADIRVEVFPRVVLPNLEKLEVKIPKKDLEIESYDEQKQIDAVLERNKRRVQVKDRGVTSGDVVAFSLQSQFMDTKRMSKRSEQTVVAEKEAEFDIPDLFREINGKKVGEQVIFTRVYGSDFKKKLWAGKTLEHHLEIKTIFEMAKPDFDSEFLKTLGFKDEEAFKKKLKQEYDDFAKNQREEKTVARIVEKIVSEVDFTVPKTLVDQELLRLGQQQEQVLRAMDEKQRKDYIDTLHVEAGKTVKFSLIYDTIRQEFKIEVSADDLTKEYKRIADANQIPLAEVRKYYGNKANKERLQESLLRVKVVDFLKEKIKVKEV